MKHPLPVAIRTGWTAALALAVQEGYISVDAAHYITHAATTATLAYLKGDTLYGKNLEFFAQDGEQIENMLKQHKINLARFGDT